MESVLYFQVFCHSRFFAFFSFLESQVFVKQFMTLTLLSGGTNGRTALRAETGGNVLQSRIRDHSDSEASPDVSNENLNNQQLRSKLLLSQTKQ